LGKEATKCQKIGIPPPILKWIKNEMLRVGELAELFSFFSRGSHGLVDKD